MVSHMNSASGTILFMMEEDDDWKPSFEMVGIGILTGLTFESNKQK